MSLKALRGKESAGIGLMIVPMIDVIFLLLLFLVTNASFEAAAQIGVELPKPSSSQARPAENRGSVVVTCEYAAGAAVYRVGGNSPENIEGVTSRLRALKEAGDELGVTIRADRRLPFADVRLIMEVIAALEIWDMHVAVLQQSESQP